MCINFLFETLSNTDDADGRMTGHLQPPESWAKCTTYGRKGFSIKDLNVIQKKYGEDHRNYLLKEEVSSDHSIISRKKNLV